MVDLKPIQVRLPLDIKEWLEALAEENGTSQNSEVVRALRQIMNLRTRVLTDQNAGEIIIDGDAFQPEQFTAPLAELGYKVVKSESQ